MSRLLLEKSQSISQEPCALGETGRRPMLPRGVVRNNNDDDSNIPLISFDLLCISQFKHQKRNLEE